MFLTFLTLMCVAGGRSRRSFPIITFPECSISSSVTEKQHTNVVKYLTNIPPYVTVIYCFVLFHCIMLCYCLAVLVTTLVLLLLINLDLDLHLDYYANIVRSRWSSNIVHSFVFILE